MNSSNIYSRVGAIVARTNCFRSPSPFANWIPALSSTPLRSLAHFYQRTHTQPLIREREGRRDERKHTREHRFETGRPNLPALSSSRALYPLGCAYTHERVRSHLATAKSSTHVNRNRGYLLYGNCFANLNILCRWRRVFFGHWKTRPVYSTKGFHLIFNF